MLSSLKILIITYKKIVKNSVFTDTKLTCAVVQTSRYDLQKREKNWIAAVYPE